MWTILLNLISKLKLQHFLIIGVVLLGITTVNLWKSKERYKADSIRVSHNFDELRDLDSLKVASITLKTNRELKSFVDSNKELRKIVKSKNIKIKNLENVILQKQTYVDTTVRTKYIEKIVYGVRNDVKTVVEWEDSSECLLIKGNVVYEADSLSVNIYEREYTNNMSIIGVLERPQRNILTRWFGKKTAKVTVTSSCGDTETVIIDKVKK